MRALIVGIDSRIGRVLAAKLRASGLRVVGTSRRRDMPKDAVHFDLTRVEESALPQADIAFLCAAETRHAACRERPNETADINVHAPVKIAAALVARGTRVVFVSSNAVFDGSTAYRRAEDPTCPITVYGEQKAEAERQLLSLNQSIAVIRLTKTLPHDFPLFHQWIGALRARRNILPFANMVMAPISAAYVADALACVATDSGGGIFQASGRRDISYYDAGLHIATRLGFDRTLVTPQDARGASTPLHEIPAHTTLDDSRLASLMQRQPPEPEAVLNEIADFSAAMERTAPALTA